jgi:hypothetical protein
MLIADQKRRPCRRHLRCVPQPAALGVRAYRSTRAVHLIARCSIYMVLPREATAIKRTARARNRVSEYGVGAMSSERGEKSEVSVYERRR